VHDVRGARQVVEMVAAIECGEAYEEEEKVGI
jgi:hypothetical protein